MINKLWKCCIKKKQFSIDKIEQTMQTLRREMDTLTKNIQHTARKLHCSYPPSRQIHPERELAIGHYRVEQYEIQHKQFQQKADVQKTLEQIQQHYFREIQKRKMLETLLQKKVGEQRRLENRYAEKCLEDFIISRLHRHQEQRP